MSRLIQKDNIEDMYPLSDIENGMIYHSISDISSNTYINVNVLTVIESEFNFSIFKHAIELLIKKHSILRTAYNLSDFKEPVHLVCKEVSSDIQLFNISNLDSESQEKYIKNNIENELKKPFSFDSMELLWRLRIFILHQDQLAFVWINHHAIFDGWSFASFITELNNTYFKLKSNNNYIPSKIKSTYKDYVILQILAKRNSKNINFWKNELDNFKRFDFFENYSFNNSINKKKVFSQNIDLKVFEDLKKIAFELNISIKNLCFAAYFFSLNMFSNENDILLGLLTHNRPPIPDGDQIVGCFLNTLPIRVKIPKSITWYEYMKLIDDKLKEVAKYERLSLFEIKKLVEKKSLKQNPLFDSMFFLTDFYVYDKVKDSRIRSDSIEEQLFNPSDYEYNPFGGTNTICDFNINISNKLLLSICYFDSINIDLIKKLAGFFEKVLNCFIEKRNEIATNLEIINKQEKHQILYEFNDTKEEYPSNKTINELFEEQALKTPTNIAVFRKGKSINYKELQQRSENVAKIIQSKGVCSGGIVGIMLDRSIEMIVGIMGILKAGGCYLPIQPDTPKSRLEYIIKDSESKLLLTQTKYQEKLSNLVESINLEQLELIQYSQQELELAGNPNDLAYIIYTSGTTGVPKGVMIENHSVINRIKWMQKKYPIKSTDVILQKTPYTFDVSVWELFWWSFEGASVYMLEPEGEKDPVLIAKEIEARKINVMHFVPSMLEAFLDVHSREDGLESLKYVFASGEALRSNQVKKFYQLFSNNKHTQLINLYGPTEATIDVSYFDCQRDIEYRNIPIGKPIDNTELYILEKNTCQLQPIGVVGELVISGVGLSRGYMKQEELSSEKFINHPFKEGEKLYRTGDLARWLPDGNIEFLGRVDHQVKIRGFRIELGDIESILTNHDLVKECVVIDLEENNEKYLCAYIVSKKEIKEVEIRNYLSEHLPDYMLPSYFVELEELPLTSNGKLNRKALPFPEIKAGDDYVAPSNDIEEKLVEIWSEVLNIAQEEISVKVNFFDIGGHSLNAIFVINKIRKLMSVEIPLSIFFSRSNIKEISNYIEKLEKKNNKNIRIAEKKDYYPITSIQSRFYIFQKLEPESTAFNVNKVISISPDTSSDKIINAINHLVERHEAFRTAFIQEGNNVVQRISQKVNITVENYTIRRSEFNLVFKNFIRSFDLSMAPILRVGHIVFDDNSECIIYDTHHILSDKITQDILLKDFNILINSGKLNLLKIQYRDYAEWMNSKEKQIELKKQQEFWLKMHKESGIKMNLPTDFKRPDVIKSNDCSMIGNVYGKNEIDKIRSIIKSENVSVYMFFFSILNIFLNKISGQNDFNIGTYTLGRNVSDLDDVVGVFINTIVIRNNFQTNTSFQKFLHSSKEKVIEAFENQEYPFEDLVDALKLKRQSNHNPIFDVELDYQYFNSEMSILQDDFAKHEKVRGKVDLHFAIIESKEKIVLELTYCDKLFLPTTIDRFLKYFNLIVDMILNDLNINIDDIKLIEESNSEKTQRDEVNFDF